MKMWHMHDHTTPEQAEIIVPKLTMEKFLAWKILPRLMMLSMTIMSYQVVQWFMALGADATTQQAAFVSTVVGAMTGAFAVWMGHENK